MDLKSKRDAEQDFLQPPDRDTKSRWGLRGKTFWDWLQLLVVPLMLALITVVFTWQQNVRQNELEDQRTQQAQKIESQRAEAERELAEQRAQDEALQAYLTQMSQLMLDRKLLEAEPELCFVCPETVLAQARTSTVILRLDAEHNESVTRFLSNSGLTWSSGTSDGLRETSDGLLSGITLPDAKLSGAYLPDADLGSADLMGADLSNAYLLGADLTLASVCEANLRGTDLRGATLIGTCLRGADLSDANLENAILSVSGSGTRSITKLEQEAASLEGATMPNGQKYEDWLKSKGSGEEGENGGP